MGLFDESKFIQGTKNIHSDYPIILYGAGIDAIWAIEDHKRTYRKDFWGCVVDGDPRKQKMVIDGIQIMALEDALNTFANAYIWVTAKDYKYEILGYLIYEKGISPDKICNYEPIVRKRGCIYAEKMFFAFEGSTDNDVLERVVHVCDMYGKCPTLNFNSYDSFNTDFNDFRGKIISKLENDEEYVDCSGCSNIKENYYAVSRKIRTYNLATDGNCNFRCCYCLAPIHTSKKAEEKFDYARVLKNFCEANMLADDLHMDLTSGEICVNLQKEMMLDTAAKYAETVSIATNASVYDEKINHILNSGRATLIVSMDAGTPETFKKVKGRDMYQRVVDNLKKYAKTGKGAVELKYIVLPNINDNDEDIDGFVSLCKDIQPGVVTISFDFYFNEDVTKDTLDKINRLKNGLSKENMFFKYEARASHILRLSDER